MCYSPAVLTICSTHQNTHLLCENMTTTCESILCDVLRSKTNVYTVSGSHPNHWHSGVREVWTADRIVFYTASSTPKNRCGCGGDMGVILNEYIEKSLHSHQYLTSWWLVTGLHVCLSHTLLEEAEELNNRLHASKQRVSELERTLSTVSTQQKQFEKVQHQIVSSITILSLLGNLIYIYDVQM